uniref:Uncharacterized protein n=1 Tax=Lates calcarifer TaxID=8187 RepID=A0A4W6DEI9_LATCA
IKFAMIFLMLTLVVLMTEPGECGFVRLGRRWTGKSQVNTHSGFFTEKELEKHVDDIMRSESEIKTLCEHGLISILIKIWAW